VPLMSMLRLARNQGSTELLRLVVSVRTPADLFYPDEIAGPETTIIYTRAAPPGAARPVGRLGAADLRPLARPDLDVYVCGSAGFADAVTDTLLELDVPAARIRVERFGPTA
jgi:ferredoxin-NADP reductase